MKLEHLQPKFTSLSKALSLATLGLSSLVLVLISSLGAYFTYQSQSQAIAARQQSIARNAANTVTSFVQGKFSTLSSTVTFNYLTGIPPGDSSSTLNKVLSLEPSFNEVALMDKQQNQIGLESRLPDLSSKGITAHINQTQLFQTVSQNKNYISQVYIDTATSAPLVVMAVPITSVYTGFSGTLVAVTDLQFMWNLVGNIKDGTHGLAYVVDGRGNLIAAGDTSRALKQQNLSNLAEVRQFVSRGSATSLSTTARIHGYSGRNVISTYAALGTPNWAVITEIPTSEAYAPITKSLLISALLILIGVAISMIGSSMVARWITKPIISLRDAANRLGAGDLSVEIAVNSWNEVGELGAAFNTMARSLQISTARLKEEHAKLEASINSLDVGFFMIDLAGNVTANVAAHTIILRTFTGKSTTVKNQPIDTLRDLDKELGETFQVQAAVDKVIADVKPIEKKAVSYHSRIFHMFIAPIINKSEHGTTVLGAVMLIEDVTEERILDRSKDEFFSIASHELRTPLTAIRGNADMVLTYFAKDLRDENLKEMLRDIYGSSVRLIDIVNDFLDVSRLEQGKMTFKTDAFPIDKIIEAVIYEMKVVLHEKGLQLSYAPKTLGVLPLVSADPDKVKQVIYNLIGNAAKFTDKGGITLSVSTTQDYLKVIVSDTGPGITQDDQALLFHKFQQAGGNLLTRNTTRGTGLGLYISRLFVEKMGGELQLESSVVGKGSSFSFTLPLATEQKKSQIDTQTGPLKK